MQVERFFTVLEIQTNRISLFILTFILFTIYCFVFGDSGILERRRLKNEKVNLENKIENLRKENARLKNLSERYRAGEFLKEEANRSGYIAPGEKVLFFNKKEDFGDEKTKKIQDVKDDGLILDVENLRILWIVFSIMILLIYFLAINKELIIKKDGD